ncbi:hypothetical protein TNCV_2032721 [Trichonephila clavipes]|nr:hypothetical protein TNCV_2032721 [Trichonephila clavipes]
MVWDAIAHDTLSPLVMIHGAMAAQQYVHDILQPLVFPFMTGLPGAIFQQDNALPHTIRMPHYQPSLSCSIPRFFTNRVHLGSFSTAIWTVWSN